MNNEIKNIKIQFPYITVVVTALLCILKLTGVLAISWWWCFCLFWLPFAILFSLIGIALFIFVVVMIVTLIIELVKVSRK